MKSRSAYCLIFLASLALLFSACTKRLADPPDPKFEPEQIKFWITADECLNKYNGQMSYALCLHISAKRPQQL